MRRHAALNGKRVIVWQATDYSSKGVPLTETHPEAFVQLLLELADQKVHNTPGYTVYADDADFMLGSNVAPGKGLANGTRGKGAGLVLHPDEPPDDGKGEEWVLQHRPLCVLFKPDHPRHADIDGLPEGVIPVMPGADPLDKEGPCEGKVHIDKVSVPASLRPYLKKKTKGSKNDTISFTRYGFALKQGMVLSVRYSRPSSTASHPQLTLAGPLPNRAIAARAQACRACTVTWRVGTTTTRSSSRAP